MNELELFAGGGGGIYGSLLLGHTPVCAVEILEYNRRLLLQRQRDGIFPRFPVWDDVCTFDGRPWRGLVDIVSGGFPCQDISAAGKGAGINGEKSGLWREMARIVREVRPRYVFVENSPMLLVRGLGTVLSDLAALGYDCRWTCLSAADCGAPHKRDRIWIVADSGGCRQPEKTDGKVRQQRPAAAFGTQDGVASWHSDAQSERCKESREHRCDEPAQRFGGICADADASIIGLERQQQTWPEERATDGPDNGSDSGRWPAEPDVCRVAHGVADWKHRIIALGNGQVPRVRAAAWRILTSGSH